MNIGLYIHIPFCKQKCFYCDFPSYAGLENLQNYYTDALCREIRQQGNLLSDKKVDSVFIGGGTPTLLSSERLARILQVLKSSFFISDDAEISMEANPGTVDNDLLAALRHYGVNRLSFGVQSFSDALLREIGRIHTAAEAKEAVIMAQKAGYENINIDLIYGLPGQTLEDVKDSLQQAVELDIPHLSVYGLKVEENTVFSKLAAAGKLKLPEETEEEAMYDKINSFLPLEGFARYEISNYAKTNYSCQHNIKYWRYKPYIGLGAAAYSFYGKRRFGNTADVQKYINMLQNGESAVEFSEELDKESQMAEFVFLALRMSEGLAVKDFNEYFGQDFFREYGRKVETLSKQGLVLVDVKNIQLTAKGMKFGNVVFRSFLPD